jgi:hypothetical protein
MKMNGNTRVVMHHDGTAYVDEGNSACTWPKEDVERAVNMSKVCCSSRRVKWPEAAAHCPCLACQVTSAKLKSEREVKGK